MRVYHTPLLHLGQNQMWFNKTISKMIQIGRKIAEKTLDKQNILRYTTTCKEKHFTGGALLWKKSRILHRSHSQNWMRL